MSAVACLFILSLTLTLTPKSLSSVEVGYHRQARAAGGSDAAEVQNSSCPPAKGDGGVPAISIPIRRHASQPALQGSLCWLGTAGHGWPFHYSVLSMPSTGCPQNFKLHESVSSHSRKAYTGFCPMQINAFFFFSGESVNAVPNHLKLCSRDPHNWGIGLGQQCRSAMAQPRQR